MSTHLGEADGHGVLLDLARHLLADVVQELVGGADDDAVRAVDRLRAIECATQMDESECVNNVPFVEMGPAADSEHSCLAARDGPPSRP